MDILKEKRTNIEIGLEDIKELILTDLISKGFDVADISIKEKIKYVNVSTGESGLGGDYYEKKSIFDGYSVVIIEDYEKINA